MLIKHDEDEVESAQETRDNAGICLQIVVWVPFLELARVSCCYNGRSCVNFAHHTAFGNAESLLLHGLMDT